ncbi:MAG TPA: LCP family protein, partial [Candidatus Eisenbergiella merdipullorum]|nr:LCP family protein [Candidatus Eisenbergiella merdipullorum]
MEQKRRRKKVKSRKGRRLKKSLLIGLAVLIGIFFIGGIAVVGGWLLLDYQGRQRLADKQEAVPEGMQDNFLADTTSEETLSPGELRYQGKTYAYKDDIMTFLFMGIDKTGELEASEDLYNGGQADALFLAALDPDEKTISVIGINRDTMTEISVYDRNGLYAGTQTAQIALAHAYGDGMEKSCENTVEAVSGLFYGLPIHGYCALNMEVAGILNDAVGGVDVTIPESAAGADIEINGSRYKTGWKAGEQVHLMGNDAYTFIRYRDTDQPESADARLERQKQYLQAFIV